MKRSVVDGRCTYCKRPAYEPDSCPACDAREARNKRAREARTARRQVMRDLGLRPGRDSMGREVWE